MTRAFLKLARAQAALSAYREALDIVRRHPAKEAEHRLLEKIASKKPALEQWRRLQEQKKAASAEADYRKANAKLLEDE
jgi:hypothetical protein